MFGFWIVSGPTSDLLRKALENGKILYFKVRVRAADRQALGGEFRIYGEVGRLGKPRGGGIRYVRFEPRDQSSRKYPPLSGDFMPYRPFGGQFDMPKWVQQDQVPLLWLGLTEAQLTPLSCAGLTTIDQLTKLSALQLARLYAEYDTCKHMYPMSNEIAENASSLAEFVARRASRLDLPLCGERMDANTIYAKAF